MQPSLNLSPYTYDYFYLSLPAKSTKWNLENLWFITDVYDDYLLDSNYIVNTLCDLDDSIFIYVDDICLFKLPFYNISKDSATFVHTSSLNYSTYTPRFKSSLNCKFPNCGLSKSIICSL